MSEAPDRSEAPADRAGTDGVILAASTDPAAGTDPAAEAAVTDPPATRPPLTSLSALLGGPLEGGAACAADGTCD